MLFFTVSIHWAIVLMTYYVLHLKDSDGILMNHAKEVYFYLPEFNKNNNTIVKQNISICACEYLFNSLHYLSISVLLYVRERHETVFTALMLRQPTLKGLLQAVSLFFLILFDFFPNLGFWFFLNWIDF